MLLSGGLDSATVLAVARAEGRAVHALSFRYGQRHAFELEYAARQARRCGAVAHEVVDLAALGALTARATALVKDGGLEVPKHGDPGTGGIPVTYVPARNTVFLAHGLAWAEALGAGEIWLGVNALDYSGYPDCRPEFLEAFERAARLGTKMGVEGDGLRVRAPLLHLRKHEIIALGIEHRVDFAQTLSCYDPSEQAGDVIACGACDSCTLRRRGFEQAGVPDPARYRPVT